MKKGAELSTNHHLAMSYIRLQGRILDTPGVTKRIARVNWEHLTEAPIHEIYKSNLWQMFNSVPRASGDIES